MRNFTRKKISCFNELKKPENDHSTFDDSDERYLVEYKWRGDKKYPDGTILERPKTEANLARSDKTYVYSVECDGVLYYWNITQLVEREGQFEWYTKSLPATTSFKKREWVEKEIVLLDWDTADVIIDRKRDQLIKTV